MVESRAAGTRIDGKLTGNAEVLYDVATATRTNYGTDLVQTVRAASGTLPNNALIGATANARMKDVDVLSAYTGSSYNNTANYVCLPVHLKFLKKNAALKVKIATPVGLAANNADDFKYADNSIAMHQCAAFQMPYSNTRPATAVVPHTFKDNLNADVDAAATRFEAESRLDGFADIALHTGAQVNATGELTNIGVAAKALVYNRSVQTQMNAGDAAARQISHRAWRQFSRVNCPHAPPPTPGGSERLT